MISISKLLLVTFVIFVCYKMLATQNWKLDQFYKALYISEFVNPVSGYGLPLGNLPRDDDNVYTRRFIDSFNNGLINAIFNNDEELLNFSSGNNEVKTILKDETTQDITQTGLIRGDRRYAETGLKL